MPSINLAVVDANNINVQVTPNPDNVVTLNRGIVGPQGVPGESNIGGYPINVSGPQNYDALMFLSGAWTNVPQTEITDGGNF